VLPYLTFPFLRIIDGEIVLTSVRLHLSARPSQQFSVK
jgi:hypothetical protein